MSKPITLQEHLKSCAKKSVKSRFGGKTKEYVSRKMRKVSIAKFDGKTKDEISEMMREVSHARVKKLDK